MALTPDGGGNGPRVDVACGADEVFSSLASQERFVIAYRCFFAARYLLFQPVRRFIGFLRIFVRLEKNDKDVTVRVSPDRKSSSLESEPLDRVVPLILGHFLGDLVAQNSSRRDSGKILE